MTNTNRLCVPNLEQTEKTIAGWRAVFAFLAAGPRNSNNAAWEYAPEGRPNVYPNNPSLHLKITSTIINGKHHPDSTLREDYTLVAEDDRAKIGVMIQMNNPVLEFSNIFNTTTGWQKSRHLIPELKSRLPLLNGGDIVGTPSLRWELGRINIAKFFPGL